jgi:hypothetical protein
MIAADKGGGETDQCGPRHSSVGRQIIYIYIYIIYAIYIYILLIYRLYISYIFAMCVYKQVISIPHLAKA